MTLLLSVNVIRLSTLPVPPIYTITLYVPGVCGDIPIPLTPGAYGNNGDILTSEDPPTVTLVMLVSAPELLSTS